MTRIQKYVHRPDGSYVKLVVGSDGKIYLNEIEIGYKVGKDGKIYTVGGSFVSKSDYNSFLKTEGFIKWVQILWDFLVPKNFLFYTITQLITNSSPK